MDDSGLEEIRAARRELDDVIAEIRTVPGYEQFLAAPTFEDVANAAREQPLVYLAVADPGGLGLVVRGDEVVHVPLPQLTVDVVRDRIESYLKPYALFQADREAGLPVWRAALDSVTEWLWDAAVGPVIDETHPAPALVMVAGGLLSLFPLHAAWTADITAPTGRRYALEFGGVGTFGIQGTVASATHDMPVLDASANYGFDAGHIYNIDASTVICHGNWPSGAHSDIAHPQIAHLFWQAALCGITNS